MERILGLLNRVDWGLAAGCLAYGAYSSDWRWAAAGSVSLLVAWYNPSKRVKSWLEKRLLASPKRQKELADKATAVRIAQEEAAYEREQSKAAASIDFTRTVIAYGPMMLGPSRHNYLKPGAANLLSAPRKTWF